MKSFDYDAVAYEGDYYCTECLPDGVDVESDDVQPVFADAEVDNYPVCGACHAEHDYMALTTEGHAFLEERTFGEPFALFFRAYLECAVWSSTDVHPDDRPAEREADEEDDPEGGPEEMPEPQALEEYGFSADDISTEAEEYLKEDARAFWAEHRELLKENPGRAGHDFWLSRNGHGAGFFDGDWGQHGDALQKAAKVYGSEDLCISEDGSEINIL